MCGMQTADKSSEIRTHGCWWLTALPIMLQILLQNHRVGSSLRTNTQIPSRQRFRTFSGTVERKHMLFWRLCLQESPCWCTSETHVSQARYWTTDIAMSVLQSDLLFCWVTAFIMAKFFFWDVEILVDLVFSQLCLWLSLLMNCICVLMCVHL